MNLADCIRRAVDAGDMDPEKARAALEEFERLRAAYRGSMSVQAAELKAGTDVQRIFMAEAAEKKRRTLLAIRAQRAIRAQLDDAGGGGAAPPGGGGPGAPAGPGAPPGGGSGGPGLSARAQAAMDVIEKPGGAGRVVSAEAHRKRVLGQAHRIMTDALATFRRDMLGRTRDPMRLGNLVRELYGVRTGDDAAAEMAEAWSAAAEYLRKSFNEAGGHIPKMERWGLPQAHDGLRVAEAGFEAWRDFVQPRLDRARMVDWRTGEPMGDAQLELGLRQAWETIRTEGWSKREPSGAAKGLALANRHADHRFLHFRDGDAWLEYQERFGKGDAFTAMMGHTAMMAREIGLMRAMGPNPRATLRWMQEDLQKAAALAGGRRNRALANRTADGLESAYDVYSGAANRPADGEVARAFMGARNFLTSSMLGAAALSATTDLHYHRMAARFSGLSGAGVFDRFTKLLNPANEDDRRLAVRLGLIAEEWSQIAAAQQRYVGEIEGPEWSQRLADFTLRASGLSAWTQAGRWAFGMEFMGALADWRTRPFASLPAEAQSTMRRYGIAPEDWDVVRATSTYDHKGASFLRPDDVAARRDIGARRADELATRVLAMIQGETEFAVPSSSVRGRAAIGGRTRPGTIPGELLRSTLMFKNFAITMYMTHIRRGLDDARATGRVDYLANLVIGATLMGAAAMTLKDLAKGRDPRDMLEHPAAFWGAALLQGGGLGIFGDFLFQDHNRFGGGFAETIAGPVATFASDAARLTAGNVQNLAAGEDTQIERDLVKFAERYSGPISSVWWARLPVERAIFDQVERLVDPKFDKRVRRLERKLERESGSGFWWRPGDLLPGDTPYRAAER